MSTSKYILWTIKYSHSVINEYLTAAAVVLAREGWCDKTFNISTLLLYLYATLKFSCLYLSCQYLVSQQEDFIFLNSITVSAK